MAFWMAIIFLGSTDVMSAPHTSRFLIPLIKWLFPSVSPSVLEVIQTLLRKGWHLAEYAILSLLVWNALVQPFVTRPGGWPWRVVRLTLLICLFYAASDELHQAFVPSRGSSVADVVLDGLGSTAGLTALWICGRWRGFW